MTTTETKLMRLGDTGTAHVWFSGVGQPAGCDLIAEEGEPLELPREDWWELQGTVEDGKWQWNGEGDPRDLKGNTVLKITAFVPSVFDAFFQECKVALSRLYPEVDYRDEDLDGFLRGAWPCDGEPLEVAAQFAESLERQRD